MITVREEPARGERRREIAALIVSVLLNLLLLWPLLASLFNVKLALQRNPERQEFIVSSSAIRIERRTPVPVPKQQPQKTVPTPALPQPKHTVVVHQPPAPRHELSRENPNAPPQPPARKAPTLAQTLAKQEQDFAREAQQIHESNNPLSIATIAPLISTSRPRPLRAGRRSTRSIGTRLEGLNQLVLIGSSLSALL